MHDELKKLPSKVPLEQFDVATFSKDKIRELYRSGRIPTAEALVEEVLLRAVKQDAMDVHFEPAESELRIRVHQEGVLKPLVSLPRDIADNLSNVLKTRASLNSFEKKKPQEGRFSLAFGTLQYDIRINIIPLITGERVALRLLRKDASVAGLGELRFSAANLSRFEGLLNRQSGLLLAAGPSGSGKSTTIYAGVSSIQSKSKNIVTVEDPVEYKLDFSSQVSIAGDKTMTYAEAVRSILRQKPDVIMIGEIRDSETGAAATEAAVTGCLVLSTMLANDAVGTVHRMLHVGIPSYWIASAMIGVVYQKLLRRICDGCRQEYAPGDLPKSLAEANPGQTAYFKGAGCPACQNTGYHGRIAVQEVLVVTDAIKDLIYQNAPGVKFKPALEESGFVSALQDAAAKAASGLTSVEEFRGHFG